MKVIKFGEEARTSLKAGVEKLANIVASTMGAAGRPVVLDHITNHPYITADGVTVSEEIELQDPFESLGCQVVKNVAREVNKEVGDGTTTSIVLANGFLKFDSLIGDNPPSLVKRGADKAIKEVVTKLKELAVPVEIETDYLRSVATISARGDAETGTLIADAFKFIGKDGQILVEEGKGEESSLEKITGYQIDKGFYTDFFINNTKRGVTEFANPYIFITNIPLNDMNTVINILSIAIQVDNRPLVIIAPSIEEPIQMALTKNIAQGIIQTVFVEAPEYGAKQDDILADLAFVVGAKMYTKERGDNLKNFSAKDFGTCKEFIANQNASIFVGNLTSNEEIAAYAESLPNMSDAEFNKKRTSRLMGRIAKLFVGAKSYVELREKRDRVEDAVGATRAALDGGVVPGGGTTLFYISNQLEAPENASKSEKAGYALVKSALQTPMLTIIRNLFGVDYKFEGKDAKDFIKISTQFGWGYDVSEMEFTDMMERGIIDPVKVTIAALEASYSVAITLILTNGTVAISPDEKQLGEFKM